MRGWLSEAIETCIVNDPNTHAVIHAFDAIQRDDVIQYYVHMRTCIFVAERRWGQSPPTERKHVLKSAAENCKRIEDIVASKKHAKASKTIFFEHERMEGDMYELHRQILNMPDERSVSWTWEFIVQTIVFTGLTWFLLN